MIIINLHTSRAQVAHSYCFYKNDNSRLKEKITIRRVYHSTFV